MLRQLAEIMPPSPVRKRGRKGFTAFYKYGGQSSQSWDVNRERIVDLLSDGRQTLMPGTQHPDGMSYIYLTDDSLEDFGTADLPELPKDFTARLDRVLGAMQTPEDKAARRAPPVERVDDPNTAMVQGIAAQLFRQINTQALMRLDEWVPLMIPGAKAHAGGGYRCRAFWRSAMNPNVGITREGIRDFGGNVGLTPIDLVMFATNTNFSQASEALRSVLGIGGEGFSMTVNAKAAVPMPEKPAGDLSAFKAPPATAAAAATPALVKPAKAPAPILMPRGDADPMVAAMAVAAREKEEQEDLAREGGGIPEFVVNAPGMIGQIADWINATAPKPQPEFSVMAALAIGATVMGRRFRTDQRNFPSLYFVMIAKSAEGKDHPQKCIRRVLTKSGLANLIGGAGYTSPQAVLSSLQQAPSHIAIIDEIGQMMKQAGTPGGSMLDGAVAKLLEVFSAADDLLAPAARSQLGVQKAMRVKEEQRIFNPALTIVGATTPDQFFSAMNDGHTEGGFMGRLILVQTNLPRRLSLTPTPQEPSSAILDWCKELVAESQCGGDLSGLMASEIEATPVPMVFDKACFPMLTTFEREIMHKMENLDNGKDDVLLGRSREKAMRMAMVVAKATNAPRDNLIRAEALEWAIKYVRHYDFKTASAAETRKPESKIEVQLKKVLGIIRKAKTYNDKTYGKITETGAMPHALLLQKMRVDSREFANIMKTAVESSRVSMQEGVPALGFGGIVYFVRDQPD
jgi:pyruvate/2-oxoglutarate dehydrogenase complex dihydrolipoamide acyltransferase (E2) component